MKQWPTVVLCLICMTAGCRTNPAISALERENRDLEDEKYELEYDLDRAEAALESCRRENTTLKKRLEDAGSGGRSRPPALLAPGQSGNGSNGSSSEKSLDLRPPVIELPSQSLPSGQIPESLKDRPSSTKPSATKPSASDFQRLEPPEPLSGNMPQPAGSLKSARRGTLSDANVRPVSAVLPRADNTLVRRITLNRFLTGGRNMDRQPGDEGVLIVIEPQDAEGKLVVAPAPVSVVLLDGALQGEAARVARWDFTAAEIAAAYRQTPLMRGFYLELPWPTTAPSHSRLQLFVRYTTDDGRNLESQRQIDIALYGQPTQRWSPTSQDPPLPEPVERAPEVLEAIAPQPPVWSPFRQ